MMSSDPRRHFSRETLDVLRHRLPDYLAARGLELRRNGGRLVGRCPNHDDSRPSFAVFGEGHGSCGCYPCGFTGDVFAVSQWLGRSADFPEAVSDVAATLGVPLPHSRMEITPRRAPQPVSAAKVLPPPFFLTDDDLRTVELARLAFQFAFNREDPVIRRITTSLGISRETLRRAASWCGSGLGLADGWLCYAYPQGLKWRNPDPHAKCRFRWLAGRATAPWRMERAALLSVTTIYLTEGESDCLAMIDAGFESDGTAACVASPGTAFQREWAPLFHGRSVVLCFDADAPGQRAAAAVATLLRGHAREILTRRRKTLTP